MLFERERIEVTIGIGEDGTQPAFRYIITYSHINRTCVVKAVPGTKNDLKM